MGVEGSGETAPVNQETRPAITGAGTIDESSPRGVLDVPITGCDSDNSNDSCGSSDSPKMENQKAENRDPLGTLQWKNMIGTFKKKSVRRFSVIPLLTSYEISRKNLRRRMGKFHLSEDDIDIDSNILPVPKPSWENFYYSELAAATNNFSPQNLLGKGGNAEVYKGHLTDGRIVAVKKLIKNEKDEDKASDFLLELGIISHLNHPNAAHLVGFSIDGGLHLVLKFSPHGSLASALFGSEKTLDWETRYKVALGVADGLQYLHHDCQKRIIHRDIKASNILLTEDNEAQISDFGLAKWLPEKWTHHVIHPIEGTFGYLAPEYFMHGIANEKTDVFAFGVLLLELLTGRRAVDSSRKSLVMWAKPQLESETMKDLVDPRVGDKYDPREVKRVMEAASACIHHLPENRPDMIKVAQVLKGEVGTLEMKQKCAMIRAMIFDGSDLQDYTRTSYLNDLDRHRQLIME